MDSKATPRRFGGFWNRLRASVLYKVQAKGSNCIPNSSGALLVSNHVSPVDPFLIRRALESIGGRGGRALARRLEFFPVKRNQNEADAEHLNRAREQLAAGKLVCLFAEGSIPRSGKLLRFTRVMEELMAGSDLPIIPMAIDRPWGSIVEIEGDEIHWNLPRRFPYPVGVQFGEALPASASSFRVRRSVQELQARLASDRSVPGETLPDKFIRSARRFPLRFAMVDHSGRKLNFLQALAGALVLRSALKNALEGQERVGVLLPPSIAGALVNAALGLLGKVAVNLNYSTSQANYDACVKKAGIESVITSKLFVRKIGWKRSEEMLHLEPLQSEIGTLKRLKAMLAVCIFPSKILSWLYSEPRDPQAAATILFSSGSTGDPKGVVLSHFNILSNLQAVLQLIKLGPNDRMVGVLPFFHAFGYSMTLWFPLAAGYGVLFQLDPHDGEKLGEMVRKYRGTMLIGPPTFFQIYLKRCRPADFASLRWAIAGAESLKPLLARQFQERFDLQLLEGYGATELSPVVSLNTLDSVHGGDVEVGNKAGSIGHPLPGIAVKTISLDGEEELDAGEEGLICVKGPNVMLGYLDDSARTAEVIQDGWYRTGDVGRIDEDGFIEITDRLSRFSKLGGEMVPHIKIESLLQEIETRARFAVTAVADSRKGERLVVVHTPLPDEVGPSELCKGLREQGLPNLFVPRPDSFIEVDEIPHLASGKLDLRSLRSIASERFPEA